MPFSVAYLEPPGVVETVHTGHVTPQELKEALAATAVCAGEHACRRHLVDALGVEQGDSSAFDILKMAEFLAALPEGALERQAILPPPSAKGREDLHFYETAARNRGVNARMFASRDEALAWLGE